MECQLQHQSFQRNPRAHLLQNGLVESPCIPRDSQESSPTPQFKSINSSAFFIVQLSHSYMTTGKTIALTRWAFVGKEMSLLFNMLSISLYWISLIWTSLVAQRLKCLPGMQETRVRSLGREDSLEKEMAAHFRHSQLCLALCDPMDCSLPGSSLHGILQARVLEWVAISFSRGSSQPRDRTRVSCIPGRHFNL